MALKEVIQRFAENALTNPAENWTLGSVQVHLELLNEYWRNFQANHVLLLRQVGTEVYNASEIYSSIERRFLMTCSLLYDNRIRLTPQTPIVLTPPEAPPHRASSRLPKIVIPAFSGKREDWESFRDLFQSLIHRDPQLSDVERLYYLKSHVLGEAKSALHALQVTGSNYATAWAILEALYEHRRLLVQDHLIALRTLKPLREESAAGLQGLLDSLERHRDQLRALQRPVESWDDWFVSIACTNMDAITRRAWEDHLERSDSAARSTAMTITLPTYEDLVSFLRRRCRSIDALEGFPPRAQKTSISSSGQRSSARSLALRVSGSQCLLCHEAHHIGRCSRYTRLSLPDRRDLALRQQLYFNCLRPEHLAKDCSSKSRCMVCQDLHHTTLHAGTRKRNLPFPVTTSPAKRSYHERDSLPSSTESASSSAPTIPRRQSS